MIDISVIIPVYNGEKYLNACLDSLLNQTKKEIEIIAVNDGSTDSSLDILYSYADKYPAKVRVITQPNQKQGAARNNGINNARGEYITFVDCDDYLKENALETMYKKAVSGGYDAVACDVDCIYPDKTVVIKPGIDFETDELSLEQKKKLFLNMYAIVCNKLYKREVFERGNGIRFESGIWYEDVLFLNMLVPYLNSISFVDEPLYEYIQRPGSVTYTYSEKLNDINYVMNRTVEYYKEKGLYDEYRDELEYAYARYMLATYVKRLSKSKDKKRFEEGVEYALEKVKAAFPNYKENKYLKKGLKNLYIKYFNKTLAKLIFAIEKNRMN
ncbi:MAG: glycosyltransferase [Clostridia bacterium]|nr:glycosyltransferase [Clostridia bacterium]